MDPETAKALAEFRRFNYERVYLRPASRRQAEAVVGLLQALVEHYADRPHAVPAQTASVALGADVDVAQLGAGDGDSVRVAVAYVGGMTDRFACEQGLTLLGWDPDKLPRSIGI